MDPIATNREELLRISAVTLAALQAEGAEPLLEEAGAAEGAAVNLIAVQRDTVTSALAAALDFARLEGALIELGPEAATESVQNIPYLPSNQALALMQSAIEEFREESTTEGEFDPTDLRWIASAFEKLKTLFRGKHKFTKHTSTASFQHSLPDAAVVALFSDWGTGEETARRVMRQIARVNPTHAIHLGDVYFSGTKKEIQKRFLDIIDAEGPAPGGCRYFALNSNHEMYSGGDAYFEITLPRFGQEASYFNLRNSHWQLIGLDSGHDDHGLKDPQSTWLDAQLQAGGPRNILLTHHQLFSPFEDRAFDRELHTKITPFLPRVFAWFWGHEHKAIIFEQRQGIHARCIGHGAIPSKVPFGTPKFPHIAVREIDQRAAPNTNQGIHGFAVLRFNGSNLDVDYIDEFGATFFQERF